MSKYWVYIEDKVAGPYSVDQLIRLRGFSRQARICLAEDGVQGPQQWSSPADIPELSHIFKAVDETRPVALPPRQKPKPATPKMRSPHPAAPTAAPASEPVHHRKRAVWPWLVGAAVCAAAAAGGYWTWQKVTAEQLAHERQQARHLVENTTVQSPSGPLSLQEYMTRKNIQARWEFDRQPTDLYNVSVIWFESGPNGIAQSIVNAFEVNLEAQTVRPLNSRAAQLVSQPQPTSPKPAESAPAKPKAPDFGDAITDWQNAVQSGDFDTVWNAYSERKIRDMEKGGISHAGFVRLQALTHKLESDSSLNLLKTKADGANSRLVLFRQTQKGRPDLFIRQSWVLEDGAWKLDDEQKKTASDSTAAPAEPAPSTEKPSVSSLPGVSH